MMRLTFSLLQRPICFSKAQQNGQIYRFDEKVNFASLGRNKFNSTYQIGPDVIKVELEDFIPNPENILEPDKNGAPIIKVSHRRK
jgi:hypothetical protein